MYQPIVGYHKDAQRDWVAELGCLHFQHVRHNPPWINRAWVISESGRAAKIGHQLKCAKCLSNAPVDHGNSQHDGEPRIPTFMSPTDRTELFSERTVPADLMKENTTDNGTWALLRVHTGSLKFCFSETDETCIYTISPNVPRVIVANQPFFIMVENPVSFHLEYYR